jgi:hypothetical protein
MKHEKINYFPRKSVNYRSVNLTAGKYSLVAAVPQDDTIMVYKPAKSGYSRDRMATLEKSLGMQRMFGRVTEYITWTVPIRRITISSSKKIPPQIRSRNSTVEQVSLIRRFIMYLLH